MSREDWKIFDLIKAARKELRRLHALPCPVCQNHLPKAHPTMLLPQERCKMHGYRDNRPRITDEEVDRIWAQFGLTVERNKRA